MRRDQKRRGEGEQFRRPNAMTRYIPGTRVYGRMSTVLSPLLSLSLSFHQLARLLPATLPPLYFGEPSSQWKLDPGFFPFYRTNEHRMARYRSRWGYFSETGLGKNGDQAKFHCWFECQIDLSRNRSIYIFRIKLILYVIFYIEDKNTSCTNFNLFVRTNLIVTLVCWKK